MCTKRLRGTFGLLITICLMLSVSDVALADYLGTVYTPNGTPVSVTVITEELSPYWISYWNNWVATNYPNAIRETDSTRKYNCHSFAWHTQSASNNKWMESPGDNTYWEDGSYVWITTTYGYGSIPSNVPNGAKVSYSWDDHSAIKISGTYFQSKWGVAPRMVHAPHYSPYYSYSLAYYKRP